MKDQANRQKWARAFCPSPADWVMDWENIRGRFRWIQAMDGVPQDAVYHAEGNVQVHTRMVAEAITRLTEWQERDEEMRALLFMAALLHDVAKPLCTKLTEDGLITSKGHARKGEAISRRLLWLGEELDRPVPFVEREYIAKLVRFHGLPLQFLQKEPPELAVIEASQSVRMDDVALLAEADVRGRNCLDQEELLIRVGLFREFCKELNCYDRPYTFATPLSRFVYFQSEQARDPNYEAYDTTEFEVVLMSGLPGTGKDTWLREHCKGWPVISLDEIRKELKIAPEDAQGRVVQMAKARARELMRENLSFAWNATNVTKMMRRQLIDLFAGYGGRVHIVYVDASWETLVRRNRARHESVPEEVLDKLLAKLEVPDLTEAHVVTFYSEY